ncbi:MAG: hypothetical protein IJY86_01730 [Clostridia bacterium]|nr:hypothetical protein [Clostridia bacterium]
MSFMSFVRGLIIGMLTAALAVLIFFPKRRRTMRRLRRCVNRVSRRISGALDIFG